MTPPKKDWKRLLELLESVLELEEDQRDAWLSRLSGSDAELGSQLRKLMAQREQLLKQDFMGSPVGFAPTVANALRNAAAQPRKIGNASPGDSSEATGATGAQTGYRSAFGAEAPPAVPVAAKGIRAPRAGMVLGGNFTLLEELGRGGMGQVFKAEDGWAKAAQDSNPYVAVKVINPEFGRHADAVIALQREAKRAHTLAHPNVITVYQFERDGPYAYITMEYLRGRTLDAVLKTEFPKGAPYERAWPIIRQVCAALEYGHTKVYENKKGIVHSDLKPSNVFVCDDGTIKLLDFGISRPMAATANAADATHFDPRLRLRALSAAYAALEMWTTGDPDPRDDIYGLGCVTYEILTGTHPFTDPQPPFGKLSAPQALSEGRVPARIPSLDRSQWEALRKALAFKRSDRMPTVAAFLQAFQHKSFVRRHAALLSTVGAICVAAGLGAAALTYRSYVEQNADFIEAPPPPHVEVTAAQRDQLEDYLTQAENNLKSARLAMAPDELTYVLSEGVNNVDEILKAALAIQPDNAQALQLEAKIARLYEDKARVLLDKDHRSSAVALALVRSGLKAQPYDHALRRLEMNICKDQPAACRAVPVQ